MVVWSPFQVAMPPFLAHNEIRNFALHWNSVGEGKEKRVLRVTFACFLDLGFFFWFWLRRVHDCFVLALGGWFP